MSHAVRPEPIEAHSHGSRQSEIDNFEYWAAQWHRERLRRERRRYIMKEYVEPTIGLVIVFGAVILTVSAVLGWLDRAVGWLLRFFGA